MDTVETLQERRHKYRVSKMTPRQRETVFTPETAKIASLKSAEARRRKVFRYIEPDHVVVPKWMHELAKDAMRHPNSDKEDYSGKRLQRIRSQLDRLDGLIAAESDPDTIVKLCNAATKLTELERSLKPEKQSRAPSLPSGGFE